MSIEFNCPHCQKFLKTADDKAGRQAKCPGCGESVLVPEATSDDFVSAADEFGYDTEGMAVAAPPPLAKRGIGATKSCPMCGGEIQAAAIRCRHCGEDLGGVAGAVRDIANYAGFWLRFVAAIVDALIVGLAGAVLGGVVGAVIGGAMGAGGAPPEQIQLTAGLVGQVIGIILNWLYYASFESSQRQATPGKMLLGLVVTDLEGRRISFGRATGRHFAEYLSALTCLVGYIMAAFTEKKQALHDMIASTLVIKA